MRMLMDTLYESIVSQRQHSSERVTAAISCGNLLNSRTWRLAPVLFYRSTDGESHPYIDLRENPEKIGDIPEDQLPEMCVVP